MTKTTGLSILLLLAAAQLPAQSLPADSLFDRLIGHWVLRGTAGDSIPFSFNYTATDRFHNTFVYNRATDSWQWHLDNDNSGVRRPFARVTLTRR